MISTGFVRSHGVYLFVLIQVFFLQRNFIFAVCDPSPLLIRKNFWKKASTTIHSDSKFSHRVFLARGGALSSQSSLGTRVAPSVIKRSNGSYSNNPTSPGDTQNHNDQVNNQETKEILESFLTRESRNTFIARVYAILAGQLGFTSVVIMFFSLYPDISSWMRRPGFGAIVPALSLLMSTIAWIIACVYPTARRSSPTKWQILALFTLGEAISVGFISSVYKAKSVFVASLATAVATTSISLYTANQKNPKYDLSQWGSMLSSFGLIFLLFGVIQLLQMVGVLPARFILLSDMAYSMFGATLFSGYIAYHTKVIVGGKSAKHQMSENDYVFGAMTLYNDIINLFIYLLKILGEDKEDK